MADSEGSEDIVNLTTALKDLVTSLNSDGNIDKRTVNITKVTSQNFRPDKYVPSLTESPKTWLSKFQSWITINRYEDFELIKHSLRLLIPEADLSWFDSLQSANSQEMYDSFVEYFTSKQPHWMIEQSLWNKTMQPGEDLETYISSIQSLASRLDKTEKETMAAFVRGLPSHLRMNVVQKDPKTFTEATKYARLCQEAFNFTTPGSSVPSDIKTFMERQQNSIDALTKIVSSIKGQATTDATPNVCATGGGHPKQQRLICQFCDKPNHTAKQCRQLLRQQQQGPANNPKSVQCDFCHMRNHRTRDCRKLRAEIKKEEN